MAGITESIKQHEKDIINLRSCYIEEHNSQVRLWNKVDTQKNEIKRLRIQLIVTDIVLAGTIILAAIGLYT